MRNGYVEIFPDPVKGYVETLSDPKMRNSELDHNRSVINQ